MPEHDVQVPEQVEMLAREQLAQMGRALSGLETRIDAVEAVEHGILSRENSQTAYESIEMQVHHLLISALEPLETCHRLMRSGGLPLLSLYPLIRASLEASAYAVWLLSPGTIAKRVFRSLHLTKERRENADAATSSSDTESYRLFLLRLNELKSMNKGLAQRSLDSRYPSITDVLTDADRHVTTTSRDMLSSWRICSGLAHSNKTMGDRVLERQQLTEWSRGSASFFQTSSFAIVESLMSPASEALHQTLELYEIRAVAT